MAHTSFCTPQHSPVTGTIKRAEQLAYTQLTYLDRYPQVASPYYQRLQRIVLRLEVLNNLPPTEVKQSELLRILATLSSIVAQLHKKVA